MVRRAKGRGRGRGQRPHSSPSPPPPSESEEVIDIVSLQEDPRSHDESGSESAHDMTHRKKKSKRIQHTLDMNEEEDMCEFLRENPIIWNPKMSNYHRLDLKGKLWEDQASKMAKTVDHLQGWYRSIRDMNTKLHKRKSGDEAPIFTERENWIYSSFDFLRTVIRHRTDPVRSVSGFLAKSWDDSYIFFYFELYTLLFPYFQINMLIPLVNTSFD